MKSHILGKCCLLKESVSALNWVAGGVAVKSSQGLDGKEHFVFKC